MLLLIFRYFEGRLEHGFITEVSRNCVVHVEEQVWEASGEVGQEAARQISEVISYRLWKILVMMFLERERG